MKLGIVDIFVLMFATMGPIKAMIIFASLTAKADNAFRRRVARRAVIVAAILLPA